MIWDKGTGFKVGGNNQRDRSAKYTWYKILLNCPSGDTETHSLKPLSNIFRIGFGSFKITLEQSAVEQKQNEIFQLDIHFRIYWNDIFEAGKGGVKKFHFLSAYNP